MKAITIHGLDDVLAGTLKKRALEQGESVNSLVRRLLGEAMGMKPRPKGRNRSEFASFSGVWTEQDRREFQERSADFSRVNPEDWK